MFGFAIAAAVAAAFVAYRIYCGLLPEETRIRRLLSRIEAGFNAAEAGTIWRELAEDFVEEQSRLDRNEVRLVLLGFFHDEEDRQGRPRFRVQVPESETEVTVHEGEPASAEVSVTARFEARGGEGGDWKPYGTIRFDARLSRPGGEWRIRRARHKTLEGRWPF